MYVTETKHNSGIKGFLLNLFARPPPGRLLSAYWRGWWLQMYLFRFSHSPSPILDREAGGGWRKISSFVALSLSSSFV